MRRLGLRLSAIARPYYRVGLASAKTIFCNRVRNYRSGIRPRAIESEARVYPNRLRDHFRNCAAALPAREPFPINADISLSPAFVTNRHQLARSAIDLAQLRFRGTAQSSLAFRFSFTLPLLPLFFFRHIVSFLVRPAADLAVNWTAS